MSDLELELLLSQKNHYKLLGVANNAQQSEIKAAYKKRALAYHPDKNKHPKAIQVFKKIANSYETLSNETKRKNYDQFGDAPPRQTFFRRDFEEGPQVDPFQFFNKFFSEESLRGQNIYGNATTFTFRFGQGQFRRSGSQPARKSKFPSILIYFLIFTAITYLPNLFQQAPKVSLIKTEQFNELMTSQVLRAHYYTNVQFAHQSLHDPQLRRELDVQGQRATFKQRRGQCDQVKRAQEKLIKQLKRSEISREEYSGRMSRMQLQSCEWIENTLKQHQNYLRQLSIIN